MAATGRAKRATRHLTRDHDPQDRLSHVGYYLIGAGRSALEHALGVRRRTLAWGRAARAHVLPLYAGAICGCFGLGPAWLVGGVPRRCGPDGRNVFGLLLMLATCHLAVSLLNWLVTLFVAPRPLPRMNYAFGIASESRTLVVVPTMLGSMAGVEAMVDALEVRLSGQSRCPPAVRAADRLSRCGRRAPARRRCAGRARGRRITALNEKYRAGANDGGRVDDSS